MFPLRDNVRTRSIPLITWGLIALNTLIFVYEASLSSRGFNQLVFTYGLVPARLSPGHLQSYATLITSAFLHGGWFHVITNMWVLFIFGDDVEDRMGHGRFLLFYLLSAVAAGALQAALAPASNVPTIGASGAIAGVLGAFFVLFPGARVETLILLIFIPFFLEIPAFVFLGLWFLSQLSSGLLGLGAAGDFGGIAWWAHIGGFLFGFLMARAFLWRVPRSYDALIPGGSPTIRW